VVGMFPAAWGLFSQDASVLQAGGTNVHTVAPFYAAVETTFNTFILSFVSWLPELVSSGRTGSRTIGPHDPASVVSAIGAPPLALTGLCATSNEATHRLLTRKTAPPPG
jgi:hypothetical protein